MRIPIPTRLEFVLRHYPRIATSPVLDVGCGEGRMLRHFGHGSVGLDGRALPDEDHYRFLLWQFDDDIHDLLQASGLGRFDYIWCSDVFEHHPSPHLFLLNMRRCLADDGVLFLGVPLVNWIGNLPFLRQNGLLNFFRGFQSQDHLNFFRFSTLFPTVRYAGYSIESWYSPFLRLRRPWMIGIEPITVLALRKSADFNYGPKAYKTLDRDGRLHWKTLSEYSTNEIPK